MAVSSDVARVVHTANGTATFFSYAPIDGVTSANLKVYLFNPATGVLMLQTLGTDYTFGGGGVTFTTAPASGQRVILFREVALLQPDIYKTNAPFPAVVTEKRLDEIVKGLQQINDVVQNRSIILPLSDAGFSSNVLPAVENRKGRVLYFNATTGDPEAKSLVDVGVVTSFPDWADSFLFQSSAAAGLAVIGAVAKAGDTMTGPLALPGAPTAANHAATKGYVDTEVGTRVAKAGDIMTGDLQINATDSQVILRSDSPSNRAIVYQTGGIRRWVLYANAATESGGNVGSDFRLDRYSDSGAYLNSPFKVARVNGQISFESTLPIEGPSATPTAANHLATKGYVDSAIAAGPTTEQVLAATAGAAVGAIGTYVLAWCNTDSDLSPGDTVAGSSLRYANDGGNGGEAGRSTIALSGTWRLMGSLGWRLGTSGYTGNSTPHKTSLWLRIA